MLAVALSGGAASAQQAPETVPLPEARPADLVTDTAPSRPGDADPGAVSFPDAMSEPLDDVAEGTETGDGETEASSEGNADSSGDDSDADAPLPDEEGAVGATDTPPDAGAAPRDEVPPMPERLAAPESDRAACRAALDELGAVWEEGTPLDDPDTADCGIVYPLTLSQIVPGVALSPPAPMRCETALALARWTTEFAQPAATRLGRGALTEVRQGTVYNCRRRNNDAEGVLSEHAFGNAVDIMSFGFAEGADVAVEPRERDGTMAEAFQDAVRASACLEFTTVLGPGSDAAHADHLHLDVKARRGGFRLCQ
ncbi:extensin family protein [uncultured Limimaricola sp.]|uniref:extensin-like domain-containing protein n=1 Tax=uncultured Limimaricola sp. TaxID=2211667 RepID=UPI0030F7C39C